MSTGEPTSGPTDTSAGASTRGPTDSTNRSASPPAAPRARSRGTVVIDAERCKGCELCVPACPPRVLRMSSQRNASGYLLPELLEGCTGCGACLLVCPDFCFEVYRFDGSASDGAAEGRNAPTEPGGPR